MSFIFLCLDNTLIDPLAIYLIANKSTISITGSLESKLLALAINAAAIGPLR